MNKQDTKTSWEDPDSLGWLMEAPGCEAEAQIQELLALAVQPMPRALHHNSIQLLYNSDLLYKDMTSCRVQIYILVALCD